MLLIPKIIHRVWLGPNEMPEQYVRFGRSWQEHHPGWEMRTWTDSDLPPFTHPGAFERCRNYAEASDVIRYEVLYRYGGVYADTDVECVRSLEPLIEDVRAFAAWQRPNVLGSAVVGSVPEHPAIAQVLRDVCEAAGSGPQVQTTGPGALTRVLKDAPDVKLFGHETFFPYDYWEIPLDPDVDAAEGAPDAYAIHHWHATWKSKESLIARKRNLMTRLNRAQKRKRELRRRLRRETRQLRAAKRRERVLRRELDQIKASRWWRLGRRLAGARRRLTALLPRGR
jgi:inositol phosphorylceramide mannosyltransferase catalytic subunit